MVFKYLALATLVASAYIGYEFNSTYVSEGYEKPLVYKAIVLAIKLGNKLVECLEILKYKRFNHFYFDREI